MNFNQRTDDRQESGLTASDLDVFSGSTQMLGAQAPGAMARAAMVNRTHRVVRERALVLQARRSKVRSLWVPTLVCSALVVILSTAVWAILDEYELEPTGIPDASQQILVLLLWFLPLSAGLLAMVWFRRSRQQMEEERQ